jgi:hypothetical protein
MPRRRGARSSADLAQDAIVNAVGPDTFSLLPPALPDFATAFALQFVLDPENDQVIALNTTGLVEFNEDPVFEVFVGLLSDLLGIELESLLAFNEPYDYAAFDDMASVRVLTLMGLFATSEGKVTLNSLEQRIDPPAPPSGAAPEPETILLMGLGLAMIGLRWHGRFRTA